MTEGVWDTTPSVVKAGQPVSAKDLEFLKTLPAEAAVWNGGEVVIPDRTNGGYKKCDANGSVLKGIGIAHFNGKPLNKRMAGIFLAGAEVYVKYLGAAAMKVGNMVKTKNDGTFEATALETDGFAKIMGKLGEGGGGAGTLMTDIVQNDWIKLLILEGEA